jgi:hypothetical protein
MLYRDERRACRDEHPLCRDQARDSTIPYVLIFRGARPMHQMERHARTAFHV